MTKRTWQGLKPTSFCDIYGPRPTRWVGAPAVPLLQSRLGLSISQPVETRTTAGLETGATVSP